MDELDRQEAAQLQMNVDELLKDIARSGGDTMISHYMVPGGQGTAIEAGEQGFIRIGTEAEKATQFKLTTRGFTHLFDVLGEDDPILLKKIQISDPP